jgi:CheY-like chemotaxis protein
VKHLVELHGGTVEAGSPGEGKGSTFSIRLPIRAVHVPIASEPQESVGKATQASSAEVRLDGIRILVVDDQPDARQVLTKVFERVGATVTSAGSVSEALSTLKTTVPHILISDIGMPETDGLDLIREIRSNGFSAKNLPAIALTAFAQEADVQSALTAGYQLHVSKPIDPGNLSQMVSNLVGNAAN